MTESDESALAEEVAGLEPCSRRERARWAAADPLAGATPLRLAPTDGAAGGRRAPDRNGPATDGLVLSAAAGTPDGVAGPPGAGAATAEAAVP